MRLLRIWEGRGIRTDILGPGVQEKFEVVDTAFYHYKMQYLEEMVCCQLTNGKGGLEKEEAFKGTGIELSPEGVYMGLRSRLSERDQEGIPSGQACFQRCGGRKGGAE